MSAEKQEPVPLVPLTPTELRKLPRKQRQAILAAAAEMAAEDYRNDKELTGFVAFREEASEDDYYFGRESPHGP